MKVATILLFILSAEIISVKSSASAGFGGPSVAFRNGQYWGEDYFDDTLGMRIPHGRGTYVDTKSHMKFDGIWKHGVPVRGKRFYEDGRTYDGTFKDFMLHGKGVIKYANGTIIQGSFINGIPYGKLILTYSNGDRRSGVFDGTWQGQALFEEKGYKIWKEQWINGDYYPQVDISKSVLDKYETIKVEVVCKVHSLSATAEILKEGVKINQDPEPITMLDQEVTTIRLLLNFSNDPFKTYTCRASIGQENTLVEDSMLVRNPFFLESHGDCGIQLAKNAILRRRKKRSAVNPGYNSPRVSMGHEQLYPGQVPWQALLWSDSVIMPRTNLSLGGFCGGTIISPYHILTAAHCLKTNETLGRDLTPLDITVKLGYTSQPFDFNGENYEVKRFYIHQYFQSTKKHYLMNDIALISLKKRIEISYFVNPVCLPDPQIIDRIGEDEVLTLSGFGLMMNLSVGVWHKPTFLQMTESIRRRPMIDCISPNQEDMYKFQGYICGGDGKSFQENNHFTADSCQGDSGGPLTYQDPHSERFKLLGLVSWGSTLCGTNRGSIYVNVGHYLNWIQQTKLLDVVDDYLDAEAMPYEKLDNGIFQAMFEHLGKTRKVHDPKLLDLQGYLRCVF